MAIRAGINHIPIGKTPFFTLSMRQPSPLLCKDFCYQLCLGIIASGIDFVLRPAESGSGRCFLRESEAAAADVFCAKAKRQQQMFFARKRSGSGRCFLRESEAAAADVFCAKAKRQRQMFFARKRSGSGNNNTMLLTQAFSQDVKFFA